MANLFDHRNTDPVDLSPYRDFFLHHSKLDLDRLAATTNMEEFVNALDKAGMSAIIEENQKQLDAYMEQQ